ncbi:MAG: hypothetical protein ACI8RD_012352, partial [Bacillariaceae sp.]
GSSTATVASFRCQISATIVLDAPNNDLNLASLSTDSHRRWLGHPTVTLAVSLMASTAS